MTLAPTRNASRLHAEALAAWEAYRSTVTTGGTPEQRAAAFERALTAEDRLGRLDTAHRGRR